MSNIKSKNITWLLTLSSIFEYYDFIIYGLMSNYLGQLFFPNDDLILAQLQTFALFSLGYIVRPFGGIILATLGDLTNRKKIFVRSNFILALATIAISILPNYTQMGMTAGIILIILRILQSITFSVELPGAMSFLHKKSKNFSFIISGSAIGAILASASLYILEDNFTREEILNYAWRIPFALGALLCLVSIMLKNKLPESQQSFIKNKTELLSKVIPEYKNIISSILIISLPAYLIIMNIFFPSFLTKFYEYTTKEVYLAMSISLIWAAIYSPIFSYLTSKTPKIALLKFIIAVTIFLGLVINFLLLRHSLYHLIIGLCIYQSIICSVMVKIFPLMAKIFESHVRFTLMTACYNITYALMTLSPILVTNLANRWNNPFILWFVLILLCIFILANLSNFATDETIQEDT